MEPFGLIADASLNALSTVQTTASANTTTSTNSCVPCTQASRDSTEGEHKHVVLEAIPLVLDGLDGGWFGRIGTSAIILFGTFGNLMTILVLRRLQCGWSALNVYLTALALSDTAMLYSGALPMWTRKALDYDLYASHVAVCKVGIWAMNTSAAVSAWVLVALTLQRAASVVWPHRVNVICTRHKSVVIVSVIAAACGALYSHTLWGYELVRVERDVSGEGGGRGGRVAVEVCSFGSADYQAFWVAVWVRVDMFVYSLLPCSFLVLGNAVLGWRLATSVREVSTSLASGPRAASRADHHHHHHRRRRKRASSTTLTVVILSLAFVLVTLPLMTYNSFFHDVSSGSPDARDLHDFLYDCFFIAGMVNFSWNFYLYCLTGSRFRGEFVRIMSRCWRCLVATSMLEKEKEEDASEVGSSQTGTGTGAQLSDVRVNGVAKESDCEGI